MKRHLRDIWWRKSRGINRNKGNRGNYIIKGRRRKLVKTNNYKAFNQKVRKALNKINRTLILIIKIILILNLMVRKIKLIKLVLN